MKKLLALPLPILIAAGFLLLGAGVTFGAIYIGGGGAIQLQKGLVGHWKMDGNAKDSTPRGNNGTLNGNAAITANDRKGQANKAATFDGTGDYIDYGDPADGHLDFGTGDFAIAYWINKTNVPAGIGNQRPFSKGAVSSEVAGYAFFASQLADGITFSLSNGGGLGDGVSRINLGTAAVTLGNWHHVVGQKSGTSQELYVDGVLANSATAPTGSMSTDKSVLLGAVNSPAELFFAGKLDDVRIYNRALSTAEITALYDQYDPGVRVADTQKGLVGNWKMDGNAKDSTPNQNNGTVTGATLTTDRKGQSNKAYQFSSASSHNINVGNGSSLDFGSGDFTYTAWINTSSSGATQVVLGHGLAGAAPISSLAVNTSGYLLSGIEDNAVHQKDSTADGTTVNDGNWHHVAAVFNRTADTMTRYVDGSQTGTIDSISTVTGPVSSSDNLYIGAYNGGASGHFNGSIDDPRAYNRALSTAEITALYDQYDPGVRVADTQKGLVGNWKMDGNAKDSTPNQNNGTVTGATLTTDRKGQSNKAYSFNGTTAFVGLGDVHDDIFAGADKKFSISAWIKPASTMTNNLIIAKLSDGSCTEDQRQFNFRLYTNSKLEFTWFGTLAGNSYRGTLGSTQITDTSRWYHIVAAYDGTLVADSRVTLYVDGVAESTSIDLTAGTPSAIADGTAHLGIGKHLNPSGSACGSAGYFSGFIDDVRIYNRVLSPTEITALYDSYQ